MFKILDKKIEERQNKIDLMKARKIANQRMRRKKKAAEKKKESDALMLERRVYNNGVEINPVACERARFLKENIGKKIKDNRLTFYDLV